MEGEIKLAITVKTYQQYQEIVETAANMIFQLKQID